MTDAPLTAWNNPTWVVALMHYPGEQALLDRIAAGPFETLWRVEEERARMAMSARRGIVAGHVLMALYAMAESPWRIAEPSLKKALHVAEQLSHIEQFEDGTFLPEGHTKVRQCYDDMRNVAHLWAAFRLHREYPTRAHEQLLRTHEGIRMLLGIARTMQNFALAWQPARTREHMPLLGKQPWLIPDDVLPLRPPWTHEPDWLLKTISDYNAS